MGSTARNSYSNRFKAKVALEAYGESTIQELSEKYTVPEAKIEAWKHELKDRAELLFIDSDQTAETLQAHAALLRTIIETSPNGIIVTNLNREVITYNRKSVSMWDMPKDVEKTGSLKSVMPYVVDKVKNPDEYRRFIEESHADIEEPSHHVIELKDGRYFERISVPYQVGNKNMGQVIHYIDITGFKRTEKKLQRFNNLLESINTNVNEGILRSTPESGLIYVNDAFVKIFGYNSKEEVLATEPSAFYADPSVRQSLVDELEEEGKYINAEVLFKRKNGTTFWGLENSAFVEENGKKYIDGVITDIDDRKSAEQELKKSEKKYRSILKNIEEGYFETDLKGNFTFFNAALVDMMGYKADQMIGMNNRNYMNEEEAQKVFETFNNVYSTGKSEQVFDWELIRGDGSHIYVEASITLRTDTEGNAVGFSGMVRNITEQKRKRKQIKDSLKEKEVLLGEIHHRVKNNLAVISGLLYLQADQTVDKKAQQALTESQNRINSMALIHELLYDNQSFSSLNPREYIEQLVQHISANLQQKQTDITTNIEAQNFDLEMSTAIPCALIINELITNAHKYAFGNQEKGTIDILFTKDENRYQLEVKDNGSGLPADFNINDSSQHSLGLSLVKTLARQLKGELETRTGSGAHFVIKFKADNS